MTSYKIAEPTLHGNEVRYVNDALRAKALSMGRYVNRFEAAVATACTSRHAVATSSGTSALHVALLALGLRQGQRVVVPACSYIATANAVRYCGATPVFADVRPDTWTLDPQVAADAVRASGAVGVITVDLYGVPCEVPTREQMPDAWTLQDACEAHGVPLLGDVAVLSFYGNKIATCGEGGAIVTNLDRVAERARLLVGQGTTGKQRYVHEELGFNYRLTDLQAALGCAQMEQLDEFLEARRNLRLSYEKLLCDVRRQIRPQGSVDWVTPVLVHDRDRVAKELAAAGIETRPVFPPLHKQPQHLTDQELPVAQSLAETGLLLPLHVGLTEWDLLEICNAFRGVSEYTYAGR